MCSFEFHLKLLRIAECVSTGTVCDKYEVWLYYLIVCHCFIILVSALNHHLCFAVLLRVAWAGNDKTAHRYPAHLPPELNTQNNLIQNHLCPPHYLYWRQHFKFCFPIHIDWLLKAVKTWNINLEVSFALYKLISNFSLTVSVIWDRPSEFQNTRLRIESQKHFWRCPILWYWKFCKEITHIPHGWLFSLQ